MNITSRLRAAIESYKNGDENAFATIYEESKGYIYSSISNALSAENRNEDFIQDIMQDTYLDISKDICKLENVDSFLSWAATIANRKTYATIKKNGKYVLLGEDESFENLEDTNNRIPEDVVVDKEKQEMVREVINTELTEDERDCVVGYYYNDMKQKEIAEQLEMPQNTVASNIFRAKSKLRKALGGVFVVAVAACLLIFALNTPVVKQALRGLFGRPHNNEVETKVDVEQPSPAEKRGTEIIPEGCEYYSAKTYKTYPAGEKFFETLTYGDKLYTPDYIYKYLGDGWSLKVRFTSKEEYEVIMPTIAGKPLISMEEAFADCKSLIKTPYIPEGVTDLTFAFLRCESLETVTNLPDSCINLKNTFVGCESLVTVPAIPDKVTNMDLTFYECTSLITAPIIPDKVTNMDFTFYECTSLITAPTIPDKVTNMDSTFTRCTSLTGDIVINANPTLYENCFKGVSLTAQGIKLSGSSTLLSELRDTAEFEKIVPEGATYYDVSENKMLEAGELMPYYASVGDKYITNDYEYTYMDLDSDHYWMGWEVKVKDNTKEKYEDFSNNIGWLGLRGTFEGCTNMKEAPKLPESVILLERTFAGCTSLEKAPVIPEGIEVLKETFAGCISLEKSPVIPESVVELNGTFKGCTALVEAPIISKNVVCLYETFSGCTSLTGTIEINAKLSVYDKCFYGLDFVAQNITLQGTSDKLTDLRNTVNEIPSNPDVVEYGDTIRVSWRSMYTGGSWTEDRDKWIDRGEKEFVVNVNSYEFSSDVLGGFHSDVWENINNSLGKKVGETFETYEVGTDGAMRYEFTILEILKS